MSPAIRGPATASSVGLLRCCPRLESEAQRSIEGFGFVPRVTLAGHFVDAQRNALVVDGFELLEKSRAL